MEAIGHNRWAIAEGYIPSESGGSATPSNCAEFALPGRTVIARMSTG